jgi:hypothetical protein
MDNLKVTSKKANILTENIIFIILNLAFLTILILFVFSKAGSAAVLEEKYAKQIALTIDAAKPLMIITLNMQDAFNKMEKDWIKEYVVKIDKENNLVIVKLGEKGGYTYSYFNDVDVNAYPDNKGNYIIYVNDYNENE